MIIKFIVPASDIRRNFLYRAGGAIYGHMNSITGPLILGSILKKAGHDVEVYEELYKNLDFRKFDDADVIGISTMTSSSKRAYEIADMFRNKMGKKVVIGGIHASALPLEALKHADQVIVGEGERVIKDIVEGNITEKIVYSSYIENLDEIPIPDYSLLKTPCKAANIMTTRGCPFNCSFCSTTRMFFPYRERSIDSIIKELTVYKKSGFKYVNFEDDNFTANKERSKELLRKMISNKLVFKETFFFGRTDMARDDELLQLLSDAHLRRVLIGIESLNQESLDSINKKQNIKDIELCGEKLKKYKIKLIASLVLGLDPDSKEDIRKSVEFCKSIDAYQLQPAVLTPFPGTPIYEQYLKENRIIVQDWSYYDMTNVTFIPKKMSPWELQEEFVHSLRYFYTFISAFKILTSFGFNAWIRRLGLWLVGISAELFFRNKAKKENGNIYNILKKTDSSK
ncbi:MAG: B12-binding domain-containing radical SAM protein [Clostridiales bacterium]|nr:B12-binding domain-containing radical SAM protein [Clostridiales bacterium]